jgi:hypothetical protein
MKDWYPEDRLLYLDEIFKKIKKGGLNSLSDAEKKTLNDASRGLKKLKKPKEADAH